MKLTAISSIIAIFVTILVGFITHNAKALEVTTNLRPWLEEEEFSLDASLHATLDQVIVFELEPADIRDKRKKRDKKERDEYHQDYEGDFDKYQRYRGKSDKDYGKEYKKEHDGNEKDYNKYHAKHRKLDSRHKKPKLYLGDHELSWNSARFLIPEAIQVSFCLPEDEPYIAALELETVDGDNVLWSRPGDECAVQELEAGRYRLHILHDSQNIDGQVQKVFFHRPQQTRLLGGGESTTNVPDFMAFRGPNGLFVSADDSGPNPVQSTATNVDGRSAWKIKPLGTFNLFRNGNNHFISYDLVATVSPDPPTETRLFIDPTPDTGNFTSLEVLLKDLGNGKFTLTGLATNVDSWPQGISGLAPVVVDSDNTLRYNYKLDLNPTTFTVDYKGYNCGSSCDQLALQEGEVAVFAECNYASPAIVFDSAVKDFVIYEAAAALGLAMGNSKISSVRVGPNTLAQLYQDGDFGTTGSFLSTTEDIACMDGMPLGSNSVSSLRVQNPRQHIASTKTCLFCDLTGIDLSDLDLTNGSFPGTTFTGANLTDTIFRRAQLVMANLSGATTLATGADFTSAFLEQADLRGADLTNAVFRRAELVSANLSGSSTIFEGTDFTNAVMQCTDLNGTDLSKANFGSGPLLETNFSCRLNLVQTILNIDTIPFADWRYLDLTGATIINNTGTTPLTLSTLENPLDLSGALLNGITSLSGAILDGANLGCATPMATDKNCTQLIDADLSKASLVQAKLADAALNGANLIQANLEMADLSGAQLLKSPITLASARLDGAFLKNANLASADLSGAALTNANWYSTSAVVCPADSWTGTCASGEGTILSNATLEGAYLNGLDLSNATLQGANLAGAMLVGANFTSANLGRDPTTGQATSLSGAFLQGADFTDATPASAAFLNAYVDLVSTNGGSIVFQLPADNLNFTGYGKHPADPECVLFSYTQQTTVPKTDSSNICPDGSSGSCSDTNWQSPSTPIGQALPPSSSDFPTLPAGACTTFGDIDFTW